VIFRMFGEPGIADTKIAYASSASGHKELYMMDYDGAGATRLTRPRSEGSSGETTPTTRLDLRAGDVVRVKSYADILATCDRSNRNRGMRFDPEMVPYCGGTYRVLKRVTRIINEMTGRMATLSNACIVLQGVVCRGRYSQCRLFCPRSIYPYWREIWLERIRPAEPVQCRATPTTAGRDLTVAPTAVDVNERTAEASPPPMARG